MVTLHKQGVRLMLNDHLTLHGAPDQMVGNEKRRAAQARRLFRHCVGAVMLHYSIIIQ